MTLKQVLIERELANIGIQNVVNFFLELISYNVTK